MPSSDLISSSRALTLPVASSSAMSRTDAIFPVLSSRRKPRLEGNNAGACQGATPTLLNASPKSSSALASGLALSDDPGQFAPASCGRRRGLIRMAAATRRAAAVVAQLAPVPYQAPDAEDRTACGGCSDYELLHGCVLLSLSRGPPPSSGCGTCPRARTSLRS